MIHEPSAFDPRDDEEFICPECDGSGFDAFGLECEMCEGNGKIGRDDWMEYCADQLDYDQDEYYGE